VDQSSILTGGPRPWLPPLDSVPVNPTLLQTGGGARMPTAVPDFDFMTGGFPTGSVILLLGEAGSGHHEFALTSAVHLMLHQEDPVAFDLFLANARGPFTFPGRIAYVSATRSREQVLGEVRGSFEPSYHAVLDRHLNFHDLSASYFADSVVPASWASTPSRLLDGPAGGGERDPLAGIARAVEADGPGNLVIVDSLTDLLVRRGTDTESILTLIKGLRRRSKDWGGLLYLLLTKGVAPEATERALADSVDGVLSFRWTTGPRHSSRQRAMIIEKFMPVLARMPAEHHGRFVIRVSAVNGLVTTQYERI
jgi:KaiC/GvpD/RAD55 family RecA-like ATPase